jgi:fructose-1,6-bisphosphatase I
VADFHRNLLKGGIYLYPGIRKENCEKAPIGQAAPALRSQHQLAMIVEQAGGMATDGLIPPTRILDLKPTELHQRI